MRSPRYHGPRILSLRQAMRGLWRSPGYAVTVIAVLALGIGAVTAIFSVVYGVLLKPYDFEGRGKLVVWHETARELSATMPLLPVNFRHFRNLGDRSHSLEAAAVLQPASISVGIAGEHPAVVSGLEVSVGFFRVLGVSPVLGRTFMPEEFTKDHDTEAVLSWQAWQRFFPGQAFATGKQVRIDGQLTTVVGVLPASFRFPPISILPGRSRESKPYEIMVPHVSSAQDLRDNTGDFNYIAIGRLRPGITVSAAQAEMDGLEKATAATDHVPLHLGVVVAPFAEEVTGGVSKSLILLLLAVAGVLLIACVNLANLQLARSVGQAGEQALRAALGASRGRMLLAALMENLLLALLGVCFALPVAFGGLHLFLHFAPRTLPRLDEVRLSVPVLLVAMSLSLLISVFSGVVPIWRAAQADPLRALQRGSYRNVGEGRSAGRLRTGLLIAEIACSVLLLAVTGLLAQSFSRLLTSARAVGAEPVTVAQANLTSPQYEGDGGFTGDGGDAPSRARDAMIEGTLARFRTLPGIEAAAITSVLPLTGNMSVDGVRRPDHPLPSGQEPLANLRLISPGYFAALGIPILSGRAFTAADREHTRVAIVSEQTARAVWPGENPVGRTLEHWDRTYTVVGVAADARLNDPRQDVSMFYLPFWDYPPFSPVFLVRGSAVSEGEIRTAIWSVDPQVAIPTLLTLRVQTEEALAVERFQTVLVSSFGLAGLLLTAIGVYSVLAYGVSLRAREWGMRMALGSGRGQLLRKVLREAARPVLLGGFAGALGAVLAEHWLYSLLYGIASNQPWTILLALGTLVLISILAALPAARRAASADPATVLRLE